MYRHTLALAAGIVMLAGCAYRPSNPVDYVTYRHEPLVEQVKTGMSKQQALTLGGPPSSEMQRTTAAGTCNNYVLSKDGKEQAYYISFNASDVVDGKGFMTCQQMERNAKAL
jgi:osmotically inducible lipoprotein OsmE